VGLLFLLLLVGLVVVLLSREEPQLQARLIVAADEPAGYLRAEGPLPLEFPEDHGPHPDYQTEWWYYTGNLKAEDGRHFGYQLTFFRRALVPPALRAERSSDWAADQVYMAHFALTDVAGSRYQAFERFSRGAAGLAGAQASPFRVWLEDWSVEEMGQGTVRMRAAQQNAGTRQRVAIDLVLTDQKGPILQGDRGYSVKGPQPGNASYYYSMTRLATVGTLQIGGATFEVEGLSWMDHEFSTSGLASDQVGWDWFSLQLDDGSELMLFELRKEDGSIDPFSSGTFIASDGSTRHLARDDFGIRVEDTWDSQRTGVTYPSRWTIEVPSLELVLRIEPHLADQELNLSYAYWEGAVQIEGGRAGNIVRGNGYIEMTGYAGSMQGQF
jgi:predicted secreted hydrolase